MNFLSLSILLLLLFTLLCLTNDVAFNVEFRDCKQSFLYHKRNLYSTNIFYYKRLQYKVFNNNVSIFNLLITNFGDSIQTWWWLSIK